MEGAQKFRNKFRIESARMREWDYAGNGRYFITICTDNRRCFFGFIKNGIMCVNTAGTIAHWCWLQLPKHFNHINLDAFVVMPNHIHGIVVIDHGDAKNAGECLECKKFLEKRNAKFYYLNKMRERDRVCDGVPFDRRDVAMQRLYINDMAITGDVHSMSSISPKSVSLSTIIRSYKSAITKHVRQLYPQINFRWQTRFYDHVIRDPRAWYNINKYIVENPKNWQNDIFMHN